MDNIRERGLKGVVTSRRCPHCGHREMGFTTEEGIFHPLRHGTRIQILEPYPAREIPGGTGHGAEPSQDPAPGGVPNVPWVPDPLWGDRRLRLKFGVLLEGGVLPGVITREIYWKGYMDKLERLISKERGMPVAAILDRIFTAPHLASGDPAEIAERLWQELEEIRRPVRQVGAWTEKRDEESLRRMIHPLTPDALEQGAVDRDLLRRELEALCLEDFLEML